MAKSLRNELNLTGEGVASEPRQGKGSPEQVAAPSPVMLYAVTQYAQWGDVTYGVYEDHAIAEKEVAELQAASPTEMFGVKPLRRKAGW